MLCFEILSFFIYIVLVVNKNNFNIEVIRIFQLPTKINSVLSAVAIIIGVLSIALITFNVTYLLLLLL
jgi:hypothetical protein